MYSFSDIKEYDHFLSEQEFLKVESLLREPKWSFSNISSTEFKHKVFWVMNLNDNPFFSEVLFNNILSKIGSNYKLDRVYANGQTYGLNGAPHPDDVDNLCYTFLLYMNREWDLLWGGDTVFLNRYFDSDSGTEKLFDGDQTNKTKKITPIPNKAVFFPGVISHYAESPARDYFGLRVTLAYKLRRIDK